MAARADSIGQFGSKREIVDLRKVAARDLDALLADEVREWRSKLDWDFNPSAELVRQYAATNSLGGAALMIDGEVAGYGYAVIEEPRGIVGDIYVRPHLRVPRYEAELFLSLLDALSTTPRITRLESQLMLATPETAEIIRTDSAARGKPVRVFERRLMSRAAAASLPPENHGVRNRFRFENWRDRFLPTAGAIVASAYKGEADSEIAAQYSSPGDARVFLTNIVEFPGCGTFHPQASFVAFDAVTGEAAGMVLSSFVAGDTGHIAQLCVLPQARGTGLGGELMRAAVAALDERGARCVSLTVTASNRAAISLYERFSFRALRTFFAFAGTWGA